jgi:hypothetical protein
LLGGREIKGDYKGTTCEGKVLLPLSGSPGKLEIKT